MKLYKRTRETPCGLQARTADGARPQDRCFRYLVSSIISSLLLVTNRVIASGASG